MLTKIARFQIDGPLNLHMQEMVTDLTNYARKRKWGAAIVIINSEGGSLRSARAIAESLRKFRDQLGLPLFCFAEDYCLNSANLILTMGTKAYMHKLSALGSFGFTQNSITFDKLLLKPSTPIPKQISLIHPKLSQNPLNPSKFQFTDEQTMQKMVQKSARLLKQEIIANRLHSIQHKFKSTVEFQRGVLGEMLVEPELAVGSGLVDGVNTFQKFMAENYPYSKVYQLNAPMFESDIMNKAHKFLRTFINNL